MHGPIVLHEAWLHIACVRTCALVSILCRIACNYVLLACVCGSLSVFVCVGVCGRVCVHL